ncbi:MAG: hypothetical protein WBJ84_03640 [Bacteroidales bacterium]
MKKLTLILAIVLATVTVSAQHAHQSHVQSAKSKEVMKLMKNHKYMELNQAMRKLWSDHMHWTLATVDAFFNEPDQLDIKLARLLDNQKHIGEAIVPFYGEAAGAQLTKLLTEHITGAVPVLVAAKENDSKALDTAVKNWYKNAEEIADFLSAANPKHWPAEATRPALESHITHTIEYSVNILKGEYKESIEGFESALAHMLQLADILSEGVAKQFPKALK